MGWNDHIIPSPIEICCIYIQTKVRDRAKQIWDIRRKQLQHSTSSRTNKVCRILATPNHNWIVHNELKDCSFSIVFTGFAADQSLTCLHICFAFAERDSSFILFLNFFSSHCRAPCIATESIRKSCALWRQFYKVIYSAIHNVNCVHGVLSLTELLIFAFHLSRQCVGFFLSAVHLIKYTKC